MKKGWAEQEMKMWGEDVCGHKMPSKGTQQFSTYLTTRNIFFFIFILLIIIHSNIQSDEKKPESELIYWCNSHINFDNTTNSRWGILKEFSRVFQENCLTSICIAVSKASSPPEARSLLWLIMMSSAHLYTAALTNSGRFTSIYSGLKCRPLASSIRIFSTV